MKLTNVGRFDNIEDFVEDKVERYRKEDKTLKTLFEYMFSESDNVMAEITDGYRIKKVTYGEFKKSVINAAPTLAGQLSGIPKGSIVGLCMSNSMDWIRAFWAILMCGYRPLLMNTSFSDELLDSILAEYSVTAVVSEAKQFSVKTVMANDALAVSEGSLPDTDFGTEVLFMSSGTTQNVKLCAYTGESFFHQVCDSLRVVRSCPEIARHYKGELKQLVLLPLYHVFGFIAVYLWFGFFSRTFVFLKDMDPYTVQNTVKKHEVTHVFAVPMVWEKVCRAAKRRVRERGEKTYNKFTKALALSQKLGSLGEPFARRALREVREGLFGDSICFLISGGGGIDRETLEFFNGIGYHLVNGYGMTEIGITSVEVSNKQAVRNMGSIGSPFGSMEYMRDGSGELLVKGRARAAIILVGGDEYISDLDEWFHTNDLVSVKDGRYYHEGRMDDLLVGSSGENLNPTLLEPSLCVAGCSGVCLISDGERKPMLLASAQGCYSVEKINYIYSALEAALLAEKLESSVRKIVLTTDPLMEDGDFKISRKKIRNKYLSGGFCIVDKESADKHIEAALDGLEKEMAQCFADALERDADGISPTANFFTDLEGTSLDYYVLLNTVKNKYSVEISESDKEQLATVRDFCEYVKHFD